MSVQGKERAINRREEGREEGEGAHTEKNEKGEREILGGQRGKHE